MKRTVWLCVMCFIFIGMLSGPAFAAPRKFVLDNGLTVLVTEMPSSPVAAVNLWVRTGSANEGRWMASGITHFIEHMLFKGTARRGAGIIPQEARAMGGSINASTGHDQTAYVLSVPKENLSKAVDLLADMVVSPSFDPAEMEREREVIVKEMHMINDKPARRLDDLVSRTVYHSHPYQYSIIGREDVFRRLTRDDLVAYHNMYYVPNNMILSVAGGVKAEEVLAIAKEKFNAFGARSFVLRNVPQEQVQIFPRRAEESYATDLTRLSMAWQGVALLDPDLYALDVLAMALGQGESSRFYVELYKKQHLLESVSAGDYTPQDRGYFEVSCLIKAQDPDNVAAAVKGMIADVADKGLGVDELAKVKRQVMVENILERQTAEGMADKAAADEGYTGDPEFSDRYLDGIRAVTQEDIKRVVRRYLVDQRLSTVLLVPKKTAAASVKQAPASSAIEKTVLPNGLVLLLKEDHSLPLVSVSADFRGGMEQDPAELNGLSALTGSVWTKGLPGESADDIARLTESRGASVWSSSGGNTIGLGMSFLSEDSSFMFDHLEKFLTVPVFPEDEIARDKEEMRTSLAARKDSVVQVSSLALMQTLFKTHPVRRDPLGSDVTLKRIQRQDIVACFQRYIHPDNGVVAVFGDIDTKSVRAQLQQRLGKLKPGKPVITTFAEERPEAARLTELTMDKEQAAVLFAFRGPLMSDKDRYAAEVLVNVLSSSLGGRLFKRVRDELGNAYAVSGGVSPGVDAGTISFIALTTAEGLPKVRAIFEEEFAKVRAQLITDEELADVRIYLVSGMARALQTTGAQAGGRAGDELLGLGYLNVDDYPSRINAVTREDVRQAALKYLDTAHAAVVLTRPRVKKTGE